MFSRNFRESKDREEYTTSNLSNIFCTLTHKVFEGEYRIISKKSVVNILPPLSKDKKYELRCLNGKKFIVTISGVMVNSRNHYGTIIEPGKEYYYQTWFNGVQAISENEDENVEYLLKSL